MKKTAWMTKILQKLNFYKKKKEENWKEVPMTEFPKTLIPLNRKSCSAFKWKVEAGRETAIKDVKMWKRTF